jgi:hypothetical protein
MHRRRARPRGHIRERRGLERAEAVERKERHIGDALSSQFANQGVVVAVRDARD